MTNKPTDIFKYIDMSQGRQSCWPWKGALNDKGMPYYTCNGKKHVAYKFVYELVHGPLTEGLVVRHKCDYPVCCNPYHLVSGTHQDNMDDMKKRGRAASKLKPLQVMRVWALKHEGRTQEQIAQAISDEFNIVVARETIRDLCLGYNHEHLKLDGVSNAPNAATKETPDEQV